MQKVQRGYVKRYLLFNLREKGGTLLLGGIFLLGAIIGSQIINLGEERVVGILGTLFEGGKQEGVTFLEAFLSLLTTDSMFLIALFLLGFCAIGQPFMVFLLLYQGLGFGLTGAYLLSQGKIAFVYYALALLPKMLCFLGIQIAATREAILFSLRFLQQICPIASAKGSAQSVQIYIGRFVFFLLLTSAASFLGALLTLTATNFLMG